MKNIPPLGAHVSAAQGLYNCFQNAEAIGAECVQIFGSSPRQWSVRLPGPKEVDKFKARQQESNIGPVFLHAPYLINLASIKKSLAQKSQSALAGHLKIAELLGAEGVIFHLGSRERDGEKTGIKQTIKAMKAILKQVPGKAKLIMETSSGGGNKIGDTIDEVAALKNGVNSDRITTCFDTAHAFTAKMINYSKPGIKQFLKEWDKKIGLQNIDCIHINDSKAPAGSKVDRHENLGKGHIGLDGLKNLAKEKALRQIPWILEVPGFDDSGPDKKNMTILRSIF